MKSYDDMKSVTLEWAPNLPASWSIKKSRYLINAKKGENSAVLTKEYCEINAGSFPVYSGQTSNEGIMGKISTYEYDFPGEGVLFSTTVGAKAMSVSHLYGRFSLSQNCLIFYPTELELITRFAFYAFKTLFKYERALIPSHMQASFRIEDLYQYKIPVPSIAEQTQIARFLDHEIAKIDALIAEQKRLIKLLQEKRQAVISHAVTKGLDPNVPMKDSGVEWLGDVPAHWEVTKLGYVGSAVIGLTYSPDDIVDDGGVIVLRSTNIQNGKVSLHENVHVNKVIPEKLKLRLGDILICSRNGSRALIGKNAVVDHTSEGFTFGAFTTVFRSRYNSFLRYIFNSQIFSAQSGLFMTTTVNQLTTGTLNQMQIPLPPEKEQLAIERFLDQQVERLDNLSSQSMAALTLLQERRSALISAAVTGKIDVRDWQPPADESAFDEDVRKAGLEASA